MTGRVLYRKPPIDASRTSPQVRIRCLTEITAALNVRRAIVAGAITAILTLFTGGCRIMDPQSAVSLADTTAGATDPLVLVNITNTGSVYNEQLDSMVQDTCIDINVACLGSPMPRVLRVLVDGQDLALLPYISAQLGFIRCYARGRDIYKPFTLAVITDRGTASTDCAVPSIPPYIVSPPFGSRLARGADQLFELDGKAEWYRWKFTVNLPGNSWSTESVLLDTVVSTPALLLPGALTAGISVIDMYVAVEGYNGSLPFQKGAVANMTGDAYGFAYAHNEFSSSWSRTAEYTFMQP